MSKKYMLESKKAFLKKLVELTESGASGEDLSVYSPFHIHEAEEILKPKKSLLKYFTLIGAVCGFVLSFLFMVYTVADWPLIVGGKPAVAFPAFIIVAFECTILIGGIVSFLGFLHLSKLPDIKKIADPFEYKNRFLIIDKRENEQ